jgi:hypothetical protein
MRAVPNLLCRLAALALMALAQAGSPAAQPLGRGSLAQAADADGDDADGAAPRRGGAEADASDDAPEQSMRAAGSGGAPDFFDAADDGPVATPNQAPDTVVCLAGCEGTQGGVIYKKAQ